MDNLKGIFAASITPLNQDFSPDLEAIPEYLGFLAGRGCHGALLLGTTGEGPSFSYKQRIEIIKAGIRVREQWPEFMLMAGTSTPSLDETVKLTKAAFDLGIDATVVLPPYYFRSAGEQGLMTWYCEVLNKAVPEGGIFLAYHIPAVSGVEISIDFLEKLAGSYPNKFSGLKDSSGDPEYARQLGDRFGDALQVFTGNDHLLTTALNHHASGCITAMANVISPELRSLWGAFEVKQSSEMTQARIDQVRKDFERFQPFPPLIKLLLNIYFDFPLWPVCPPLEDLSHEAADRVSTIINLA
jgi:4-hydroxy-tetrahydrodipicolinate synthase